MRRTSSPETEAVHGRRAVRFESAAISQRILLCCATRRAPPRQSPTQRRACRAQQRTGCRARCLSRDPGRQDAERARRPAPPPSRSCSVQSQTDRVLPERHRPNVRIAVPSSRSFIEWSSALPSTAPRFDRFWAGSAVRTGHPVRFKSLAAIAARFRRRRNTRSKATSGCCEAETVPGLQRTFATSCPRRVNMKRKPTAVRC
jgi:hypothetical protein